METLENVREVEYYYLNGKSLGISRSSRENDEKLR